MVPLWFEVVVYDLHFLCWW